MALNKILLIGNVGKTPEVRTIGDTKVAQFNLATTEKFKGKDGNGREETEWHNISVWGKLADVIERYVDKGSQLYVEGRLKTEKYSKDGQDRFITRIIANSIQLLGGKRDGDASSSPAPQTERPKSTPLPTVDTDAPDDDLPFR